MAPRAPRKTAEVRRVALRLLRAIDPELPFDPAGFCARLGEHRGRPIHYVPHTFADAAVFGLWIGTDTADHVFVERETTPSHQRHIVLHEIGHIVFDHGGDDDGGGADGGGADGGGADGRWRELTVTVPQDVVAGARPRSSYDTASEYEAELFASIVEEWIARMDAGRPRAGGPRALHAAFDDPWGWR